MKFTLTIESDDAAPTEDAEAEVVRLLNRVANDLSFGITGGQLRDINGNRVGTWELGA